MKDSAGLIRVVLGLTTLVSAGSFAATVVDCPATCATAQQFGPEPTGAGQFELMVTCHGAQVTVRLDFGRGHVVEREIPQTAAGCQALPELVHLLASSVNVGRPAASPAPSPPAVVPVPVPSPSAVPPVPVTAPTPALVPQPPPPHPPEAKTASPQAPMPSEPKASAPPLVTSPPVESPPEAAPAEPRPPTADAPAATANAVDAGTWFGGDVGGGIQASPVVWSARVRAGVAPWSRVGLFIEGALTTTAQTALVSGSASSASQQGAVGVLLSWRAVKVSGPRLALGAGVERIAATGHALLQPGTDAAVGVVFTARLEWYQPVLAGFFVRAFAGVDLRPVPWSVTADGPSVTVWTTASPLAGLAIGWTPTN